MRLAHRPGSPERARPAKAPTTARGAEPARRRRRNQLAAVGAALLATGTGILAGAGSAAAGSAPSGQVALVAYSTPAPAYDALIKAFQATSEGKNVTFTTSFGPSGSQSRSVAAGLPADVVNFSLATDMERLVKAKLVSPSWNADPTTHGMVTNSVVVFVVPKGNPEHVKTWADLVKSNTRVFTPNPFSSGSARWNLMAAYGAELKLGQSASNAQSFLRTLLTKTVVQDTSAATELQAFLQDESSNKNDVLLDYEDDAIQAERAGRPISYVIPPQTILIQNPIAVTANSKNSAAAQAFVSFLLSPAGQEQWARLGYRPVRPTVAAQFRKKFPDPPNHGLFTIQYLGGWDQVATTFFGTKTGVVTQIEQSLGASTSSS